MTVLPLDQTTTKHGRTSFDMDKEDKIPIKKTGATSRKTGDNTTTKGTKNNNNAYDSKRRKRGKGKTVIS